mgnify:FL=1
MSVLEKVRSDRRRDLSPIKVYCTSAQRQVIEQNAIKVGMSLSTYLQRVGTNCSINVQSHNEDVEKLLKINADLGRLGGLIKLWLTNDRKTKLVGQRELHRLLGQISTTQSELIDVLIEFKRSLNSNG